MFLEKKREKSEVNEKTNDYKAPHIFSRCRLIFKRLKCYDHSTRNV